MRIYIREMKQRIETNYWESRIAFEGHLFASMQETCCTLLFPKELTDRVFNRIIMSEEVVISKGPYFKTKQDYIEFLFENLSYISCIASPYAWYCKKGNYDGEIINNRNSQLSLTCSVWFADGRTKTFPAYYRETSKLPCLQPWDD
jgi:hypothetical protein